MEQPPPAYSASMQNHYDAPLKRKPLPPKSNADSLNEYQGYEDTFDIDDYYFEDVPAKKSTVQRPGLCLNTLNITPTRAYSNPAQLHPNTAGPSASIAGSPLSPTLSHLSNNGSSTSLPSILAASPSPVSSIQKTFRDARHFAGGLIPRPSESTKHFTIVRHSHGLVFYQGPSTSIAITIFSDAPLPPDRTLWLQSKGWSGKTGMRLKGLLGQNESWLNVTPKTPILAYQLNPSDERAWQRDIQKFRKKGPSKVREKHLVRETAVVAIPAEAEDGYFHIVLCLGDKKKVLCQSPVFRVISASRNPSSIRGASLTTLPLELGVMVGSVAVNMYAQNTIGRATAIAAPVTSVVQGSVAKYMPSVWAQQAVSTMYGIAEQKISSAVEDGNEKRGETQNQALVSAGNIEATLDEGPRAPYPISLVGRCQSDVSIIIEGFGMPKFSLNEVADSVLQKLEGYYFGWARVYNKKSKDEVPWCQAIVSVTIPDITQLTRVKVGHTPKKNVALRLMTDFDDLTFEQEKWEVQVMGFIRPDNPAQCAMIKEEVGDGNQSFIDDALISEFRDISITQGMLDHPAWSVEAVMRHKLQERKTSGLQKISETVSNTRLAAQRQINLVPLHKAGVRLEAHKTPDNAAIATGFYVLR
ncbi:hypothetical protein B0O99DRAFT_619191 [Bisporella sp. PMI_857]|nr:hypothetical protein B0O99DRAFT_619191 [Bisporella sp. PMI_857]